MKLIFTVGCAAVLAAAVVGAIGHSTAWPLPPMPRPKPVLVEAVEPPEILQPHVVRSIPITREQPHVSAPPPQPKLAALKPQVIEQDEPPPSRRRYRRLNRGGSDICSRHGMRKVDYGRTWRCRR